MYIEEHITFLDNVACIILTEYKLTNRVVVLYEEALKLASKYLLKNDARHFYLINNLMCAYFEKGEFKKGEKYFNRALIMLKSLKSFDSLRQIQKKIQENYQFYLNKQNKIRAD